MPSTEQSAGTLMLVIGTEQSHAMHVHMARPSQHDVQPFK